MIYIENNLLPACTYNVIKRSMLRNEDRLVLTKLYQPIMGQLALSLYFSLWADVEDQDITDEHTHHRLMSLMQIDLTEFIHARHRLEALGLLRSYESNKNQVTTFVYELYAPVTPNDFFNNPVLNELLYNYLGEKEYNNTKYKFILPEIKLDQYKEVTKNFREVFEFSTNSFNLNEMYMNEYSDKVVSPIQFKNNAFDFDLFYASLPRSFMNKDFLTPKDKDLILKLHSIYNTSENAMIDCSLRALTPSGSIDVEQLRSNVRDWYNVETSGKLVMIERTQPTHLKTNLVDDSMRTKMIKRFENETPYQFLKNAYNGAEPFSRELNVIENLMINTGLLPGVVNVLIDYVLLTNNHKLTKNYIEAIASQWRMKNIETVEEAMAIAEKEHDHYFSTNKTTNSKNSYKNKNSVKETTPEWFNKNIEKEEIDHESKQKLESMISKYL